MSYLEEPRIPGLWSLTAGVLFPGAVILIELLSGLCANAIFDPLPTAGHLLLVAAVPVANAMLWRAQRAGQAAPQALLFAGSGAAMVSAAYLLLLLPILPIAFIGILFFGLGLLPFAPLMTLIFGVRWTAALVSERSGGAKPLVGGAIAGVLLLALVDLPATATYLALDRYSGGEEEQSSAVNLVRTVGDPDILLRLSYGDTARASGVLSTLVSVWGEGMGDAPAGGTASARELYFRVTGEAFNASPPPAERFGARPWLFTFDEDQGGTAVGGRVPGLALAASRIDGSIATADNLGYFEWTVEVSNADPIQHEARLTIALPEGAVASRATLWVNGEPREASVAGRAAARAAYSGVVAARRDPLLVTTDGAQRLLVQAFPILPGARMKLRIGFTAPFEIAADGRRRLALPAIVDRNFAVERDLRHHVWIDSDGRIASPDRSLASDDQRVLRGLIDDQALLARRPRIAAEPVAASSRRIGRAAAARGMPAISVAQVIERAPMRPSTALMIVVDGSASNKEAARALVPLLDRLPAGLPVGVEIADGGRRGVASAPWSSAQRERIVSSLDGASFEGGEDNGPALAAALDSARDSSATLLWIHGPQPVAFPASQAQLEQAIERSRALPRLIRYQSAPGRALTSPGMAWFDNAAELTPSIDLAADLRAAVERAVGGSPGWTVTRSKVESPGTPGSAHIVRLWAAQSIAASMAGPAESRPAGVSLARQLNLVTPLSGAVVLETDREYTANNLPVPSAEDVPTVPEPGTWALLAMLALLLLWLHRRGSRGAFA